MNPPTPPEHHLNAIDLASNAEHRRFADDNGIAAEDEGNDQILYKIDRAKFREGLAKASNMGGFFAQRAARATTANHQRIGTWPR